MRDREQQKERGQDSKRGTAVVTLHTQIHTHTNAHSEEREQRERETEAERNRK